MPNFLNLANQSLPNSSTTNVTVLFAWSTQHFSAGATRPLPPPLYTIQGRMLVSHTNSRKMFCPLQNGTLGPIHHWYQNILVPRRSRPPKFLSLQLSFPLQLLKLFSLRNIQKSFPVCLQFHSSQLPYSSAYFCFHWPPFTRFISPKNIHHELHPLEMRKLRDPDGISPFVLKIRAP